MIGRKQGRREVLIGRAVTWKRAATPLRDCAAVQTMATLAATERQAVSLVSIKLGPCAPLASFKINVDVMQRFFPCHAFFGLYSLVWVSGGD